MSANPKKNHREYTPQKRDALPTLSAENLECRSYRFHAMESVGYFYWKTGRGKGVCKVSRCIRCDTFREDYLMPNGTLTFRKYHYPENYLIAGEGVLLMEDVRREMLRRVEVIHASPDDLPVPVRVALVGRGSKKNLLRGLCVAENLLQ
jgi:hypothetical protein